MLDLEFDQEQELLRQTVRDVLGRHCSLDVVREMEDDPVGYPAALWSQLGELDLIGLLLPEAYGGSGMSLVEGVALYEELGRALAPTPHFVSAVMSGGVLAAAGSEAQKEQWLRPVASGEAILTPAWLEPENGFSPRGVEVRAEAKGPGFRLNGVKRHVAFAAAADRLVVLARTGEEADAVDLFLVDPTASGVGLRQQFSISSDTQYEVTLTDVVVGADDRIGPAGSGWATWQEVLEPALVLLAAQAVGGRATRSRSLRSTPRTATSSTSRSVRSRRWRTISPTPSPTSTGPNSWCTRRPGPGRAGGHSGRWRRWPSCSRAPPSATSPPWPSSSSAASGSRSTSTSSSTSGGPSSSS